MEKRKSFSERFAEKPAARPDILATEKTEFELPDLQCVGDEPRNIQPESTPSGKTYILGVELESRFAPIMHDADFDIDKSIEKSKALDGPKIFKENLKLVEEKRRIAEQKMKDKLALLEIQREEKKRRQIIQQKNESLELEKKRQEKIQQAKEERKLFDEAVLQRRVEEKFRREEEMRENTRAQLAARELIEKNLQEDRRLYNEAILQRKMEEKFRREEEIKESARAQLAAMESIEKNLREERVSREATVLAERELLRKEQEDWLAQELKEEKKRSRLLAKKEVSQSFRDMFSPKKIFSQLSFAKNAIPFASFALAILVVIGAVSFVGKGFGMKGQVLGASQDGYANISAAINDMTHQNFEGSSQQFALATQNFTEASENMQEVGGSLLDITRFIPYASKLSSGKNAVEAGKHFSVAGQSLNEVVKIFAELKDPAGQSGQKNNVSLLELFQSAQKNAAVAKNELDSAQQNMNYISVDDLPQDKRDKFILLKQQLPEIRSALDMFLSNSDIFVDLFGGNGPRKYLFLFQNNSEMRATGGFIGSYGLLDIANGHVKKFFIDGIFNPDGQLQKKIVPPAPIQKISAAWSMHDSNWFADFPTSAQKAIQFYEMTGGPTADGVIALTPTVMQKLLEITGPIEMPDYDVTLNSENFIELTQYKIEVDYDKVENQPKKILSDLAPLLFEKLLSDHDPKVMAKVAEAFLDGLKEKHILIYSQNMDLEKIISAQGWSGEVLPSQKDYLSVINTNINGFKTDAVIDEKISHQAEIQADGSVIDTVTITRHHRGGDSQYEWLNKVNADYMRVYVPMDSKLLEVSGQSRETNEPPLDYDNLGFQRDTDVQKEEQGMTIDSSSGTRVYNENGKTVFANWTYVSPRETMSITYKYLLPFRLFQVTTGNSHQADSYSLVAQKQSGSIGSDFSASVKYPQNYSASWIFPQGMKNEGSELSQQSKLDEDRYVGVVFERSK